ncbi:hypothetical protein pb186bvf_004025 [Paramecium bursaria]
MNYITYFKKQIQGKGLLSDQQLKIQCRRPATKLKHPLFQKTIKTQQIVDNLFQVQQIQLLSKNYKRLRQLKSVNENRSKFSQNGITLQTITNWRPNNTPTQLRALDFINKQKQENQKMIGWSINDSLHDEQ